MQSVSVVGMFCEDIREEVHDLTTLVGLIPDNANMARTPGMIPKLGVYIRIHFDASDSPPVDVSAVVILTDGNEVALPAFTRDTIDSAFTEARKSGTPLAGLIMKASLTPFIVSKPGFVVAKVRIDGREYAAANVKITANETSTASEQPASQPEPAPKRKVL